MKSEKVPLEVFVRQVFATRAVQQIVDRWPIKAEIGLDLVVKHLEELGIFTVEPMVQGPVISKQIVFFLQNSPSIIEAIAQTRKAAAKAAKSSKSRAGRE